jgi:hypothetical protein
MAGENPAERRQAKRLPLNLPLRLKWSRRGAPVQELGTVRDISPVGVYFLLSHDLKPKGKLEFFVPLQLEGAPEGGVLMHCTGRRVVRVEGTGRMRVGVAAQIDRYRLQSLGQAPQDTSPRKPAD